MFNHKEPTQHLDLGCGSHLRNPYHRDLTFGVDQSSFFHDERIRDCQLGLNPLPFESDRFDSVSAFDLLEHIPRQSIDHTSNIVHFPFLQLMTEVYRVLKDQGVFFALTPAYPAKEAFQDPTHVNFITDRTHSYFVGPNPMAGRYGFSGHFALIRAEWVLPEQVYHERSSLKLAWKAFRYRCFKGGLTHLVWEFRAIKGKSN